MIDTPKAHSAIEAYLARKEPLPRLVHVPRTTEEIEELRKLPPDEFRHAMLKQRVVLK